MKIDIMCSCCGNHETVSNRKVSNSIDLIKRGWGSCGSALYCPECTRTWKERNGDRPMADERNTFFVILNLFMDALREADT
jgi:hypothetical protein